MKGFSGLTGSARKRWRGEPSINLLIQKLKSNPVHPENPVILSKSPASSVPPWLNFSDV
jgi:hypothetical protein